jgi:N-acetylated-alpha-linked acidic dipeptidase
MADESSPLIRTAYVRRGQRRTSDHVCRRFCTIALSSILIASFVAFVVGLFVEIPDHIRWPPRHGGHHRGSWLDVGETLNHEELQAILFDTPSAELAEQWSGYYTAGPHLAGRNYSQV